MKKGFPLGLCMLLCVYSIGQKFSSPQSAGSDSVALDRAMAKMATQLATDYYDSNREAYFNNLVRIQLIAGNYEAALTAIDSVRSRVHNNPHLTAIQFELFAKSRLEAKDDDDFQPIFKRLFRSLHERLSDKEAFLIYAAFQSRYGVASLRRDWMRALANQSGIDSIDTRTAIGLIQAYSLFKVSAVIEPLSVPLLAEDDQRRYIIDDHILIPTKNGAILSAVVVRSRKIEGKQPAAFDFTIYADNGNLNQAKGAAAWGYVGVVGLTRGKRLSPNEPVPYEKEATDVNEVIDWIVKQEWSNGKVGMYGGSYDGFAQWAAAKHLHPALKTIVPYVAAIPGLGVPMENNVFINANYGWAFYTTNNKWLDDSVYFDPQRWNRMQSRWYESGVAFNKIDSIDGTPNKWRQRWLQHPSFDNYWQNMVPYKQDFAQINIPVLSVTGYYDDGQISAMQYLREHYRYNPAANHYLIIGPYDHFGAQRGGSPVLRDYTVDPVALINTREITFQWFDYILKNGKKPEILQDRINYQVMGSNEWKHAASIEKLNSASIRLFLTTKISGDYHALDAKRPARLEYLEQSVDLADRQTSNNDYYPYPIIRDSIVRSNGLFFIGEALEKPMSVDGSFSGVLKASINKKDMDIGVVLYELLPDGRFFHLSYFLGRASYAADMSVRKLLRPGKIESIPFERTRMVSRLIGKGSRLVVVLNINKNSFAQINYGTGGDVSKETIADAKEPLIIKWYNDSFVRIPMHEW